MTWTTNACDRVRRLDGIVHASFAEAGDGLPFSKAFRGEVQLDPCDDDKAAALIERILAEIYEAGDGNVPRGSLSVYTLTDGVRKNLRVSRLSLPSGLRAWGSSITVPEGWLQERFGRG